MMMMIGLLSGLETKIIIIIIIIIITYIYIYIILFILFYFLKTLKLKFFKSTFYKVPSDSVKNGILRGWRFSGILVFPMRFILFSACSQCVFNGSLLHSQFVPWIVPNRMALLPLSFAQSSNFVWYIYIGHKERLEHIYWECRRFEWNSFGMGQSKWLIISKINQTFECIPSTKFCQILPNWVLITYQPVVDLLIINNNLTCWYWNFKF